MATIASNTMLRAALAIRVAASWTKTVAPFASRPFSTERTYGGLTDEDRIFTNLYGKHDAFLKVSIVRRSSARPRMNAETGGLAGERAGASSRRPATRQFPARGA